MSWWDALGSKVDTLSETDLMEELEKLAVVKTVAVVQAVDYPAMIPEEKPVQQTTEAQLSAAPLTAVNLTAAQHTLTTSQL